MLRRAGKRGPQQVLSGRPGRRKRRKGSWEGEDAAGRRGEGGVLFPSRRRGGGSFNQRGGKKRGPILSGRKVFFPQKKGSNLQGKTEKEKTLSW